MAGTTGAGWSVKTWNSSISNIIASFVQQTKII